ncbi:hypothetical protein [Arthrobacter antibioticus]|uniref:hypothetical protein n=1 Tax=Arthrobacter sp. H35-MC1 TaxID=3046203 RepID=UPI0024BA73C5|nr:hypothetical protein [Arthrobacter sp. H35-MC1]MDJ0317563.1 hypothetical protein [Arthrobacter sp. H35-MC1]
MGLKSATTASSSSLSRPLALLVAGTYLITLAVGIPISGWLAERFGARRVFA